MAALIDKCKAPGGNMRNPHRTLDQIVDYMVTVTGAHRDYSGWSVEAPPLDETKYVNISGAVVLPEHGYVHFTLRKLKPDTWGAEYYEQHANLVRAITHMVPFCFGAQIAADINSYVKQQEYFLSTFVELFNSYFEELAPREAQHFKRVTELFDNFALALHKNQSVFNTLNVDNLVNNSSIELPPHLQKLFASDSFIKALHYSACLHDFGKIFLDEHALESPVFVGLVRDRLATRIAQSIIVGPCPNEDQATVKELSDHYNSADVELTLAIANTLKIDNTALEDSINVLKSRYPKAAQLEKQIREVKQAFTQEVVEQAVQDLVINKKVRPVRLGPLDEEFLDRLIQIKRRHIGYGSRVLSKQIFLPLNQIGAIPTHHLGVNMRSGFPKSYRSDAQIRSNWVNESTIFEGAGMMQICDKFETATNGRGVLIPLTVEETIDRLVARAETGNISPHLLYVFVESGIPIKYCEKYPEIELGCPPDKAQQILNDKVAHLKDLPVYTKPSRDSWAGRLEEDTTPKQR